MKHGRERFACTYLCRCSTDRSAETFLGDECGASARPTSNDNDNDDSSNFFPISIPILWNNLNCPIAFSQSSKLYPLNQKDTGSTNQCWRRRQQRRSVRCFDGFYSIDSMDGYLAVGKVVVSSCCCQHVLVVDR